MVAWQMYQESLCDGCGQDRDRAYNPDMDGWYEIRPVVCQACAVLEQHRDKQKLSRAVKEYLIDTRPASDRPEPWNPEEIFAKT